MNMKILKRIRPDAGYLTLGLEGAVLALSLPLTAEVFLILYPPSPLFLQKASSIPVSETVGRGGSWIKFGRVGGGGG